jgi:DNA-directed RNA polymerase specialized sigma24 family protein
MRRQLSEQEAEELAQETMLMLWQKADRLRSQGRIRRDVDLHDRA